MTIEPLKLIMSSSYLLFNNELLTLQVRLDQMREDAGRNSVTFMVNVLIIWRDAQHESEARRLLYRLQFKLN